MEFCTALNLPPALVDERVACLFVVALAKKGLKPASISCYMAAVQHLQVELGFSSLDRSNWPRFQYVLRGIRSSHQAPKRTRLPITSDVMHQLFRVWSGDASPGQGKDRFTACLLWAASCLAYFGFMWLGELLGTSSNPLRVRMADVSVDCHTNPSVLRVFILRSKTDPFGVGVSIFLGQTSSPLTARK